MSIPDLEISFSFEQTEINKVPLLLVQSTIIIGSCRSKLEKPNSLSGLRVISIILNSYFTIYQMRSISRILLEV